jgi:hypothetical protein
MDAGSKKMDTFMIMKREIYDYIRRKRSVDTEINVFWIPLYIHGMMRRQSSGKKRVSFATQFRLN